MKTTAIDPATEKRLAQLETESQSIIDAYLKLITTDVHSPVIKDLQNKLIDVRNEQWKIFERTSNIKLPAQAASVAA